MLIHGSCHCGNIAFALDWTPEPAEIPARACTCSFCTRHGGVWTSCPSGTLRVTVREPAHVSKYAFGTETAIFHVCAVCGVVPLATSRIEGKLYAVVNVNAFEDVAPALLRHASANLDGEALDDRLARRKGAWIARVDYPGADA